MLSAKFRGYLQAKGIALQRQLGAEQYGSVFEVMDGVHLRAMKVIKEEGLLESKKKRLLTEREAVCMFKHWNVMNTHKVLAIEDSTVFIIDMHVKDLSKVVPSTRNWTR